MALLFDLGNTALKWALSGKDGAPHVIVHATQQGFANKLALALRSLNFNRAYGCSVASHSLTDICTSVFTGMHKPVVWLSSQQTFENEDFILTNRYRDPAQLGSDRWHAALGAVAFIQDRPLLVIHSGTAMTVDSVIPEGGRRYAFCGGRIAPGVVLMHASLTQTIPALDKDYSEYDALPKDTASAITTGIIDAHLGVIERAVRAMQGLGSDPILLLAGGAAKLCAPYLRAEFPNLIQKHNLVLTGIELRAKVLQKGAPL